MNALSDIPLSRIPVALLRTDATGVISECNARACALLGRSRVELVGTPMLRWIRPGDRPLARSHFQQALTGGAAEWMSGADTSAGERSVILNASALADEREPGVLVFMREGAAAPRRDAHAGALAFLADHQPGQFVLVLDEGFRIRFVSSVSRELWLDETDVVSRELGAIVAPCDVARTRLAALRRVAQGGQAWRGVLDFARRDGTAVPFDVTLLPMPVTALRSAPQYVLHARDATAEQRLTERTRELERLSAAGQGVVEVTRALREALATLELNDSATNRAALDTAARMVDALQYFGTSPAERGICDVRDVVAAALRQVEGPARDSGVTIVAATPTETPTLLGDAAALTHAVVEVLSNALDAVHGCTMRRIDVSLTLGERSVILTIADSGRGLPAGDPDRIFAPFHTTKQRRPGLGLAKARSIVHAHGGRIWAAPQPNGGARIGMELPFDAEAGAVALMPSRPLERMRERRVLIVDDEASLRKVIRRFLERLGFEVTEAWSGRSAMAALTSGARPDFLLTDLRMKDGSGDWLIEQLQHDFPALLKRTILMTGAPDAEAVERISRTTGCPVMRKPFELPALLSLLHELAT